MMQDRKEIHLSKRRSGVFKLLDQAGIDVDRFRMPDGTGYKQNRQYCSKWSFGRTKVGEPGLLSIWDDYIVREDNEYVYDRSALKHLEQCLKENHRNEYQEMIKSLAKNGEMFRVFIVCGKVVPDEELNRRTSRILNRTLDRYWWYVKKYNETTHDYVLARSSTVTDKVNGGTIPKSVVLDILYPELSTVQKPTVCTTHISFERNPKVADNTKQRANGKCEFCSQLGFLTAKADPYLECHHIKPLGEGGVDHENNTAAVCANCHHEAHYGTDARRVEKAGRLKDIRTIQQV